MRSPKCRPSYEACLRYANCTRPNMKRWIRYLWHPCHSSRHYGVALSLGTRPVLRRHLDTIEGDYHRTRKLLEGTLDQVEDIDGKFKRISELEPIVSSWRQWKDSQEEKKDLMALSRVEGKEMQGLIQVELEELEGKLDTLERQLLALLLPKDALDEGSGILELRAGTGGTEAGLFAQALLDMYQNYALRRGWTFELISRHLADDADGDLREASVSIHGTGVYGRLKFESGVHRVQRVPLTDHSGRVHTSTATVAVLPKVEEVACQLDERDIKFETYRASGAGGQHVNTTNSAVRLTHLPSGIVVSVQDERSQGQNKKKAMDLLAARLYQSKKDLVDAERTQARRLLIGTGGRHEKIRTYNFPQGRVTDHRVNVTLHTLDNVLEGDLDPLLDILVSEQESAALIDYENTLK